MSYFRTFDLVTTPAGPGTFCGYWPDRTLAKVRLESGRTRSFGVAEIHKRLDISETAQCRLDAIRDVFRLPPEDHRPAEIGETMVEG